MGVGVKPDVAEVVEVGVADVDVEPKIFVSVMLYEYVEVTGSGLPCTVVCDFDSSSIPDALS